MKPEASEPRVSPDLPESSMENNCGNLSLYHSAVVLPEEATEKYKSTQLARTIWMLSLIPLVVISIFIFQIGYLHYKHVIGTANPHGTVTCAYDEEGFMSIAFMSFKGNNIGPTTLRQILYTYNKLDKFTKTNFSSFDQEEHVFDRGVVNRESIDIRKVTSTSSDDFESAQYSPHAITCRTASAKAINDIEGPPVSFVADPFLFLPPKQSRSLGFSGYCIHPSLELILTRPYPYHNASA